MRRPRRNPWEPEMRVSFGSGHVDSGQLCDKVLQVQLGQIGQVETDKAFIRVGRLMSRKQRLCVSVRHTHHTQSRTPADLPSLNSGSEFFFPSHVSVAFIFTTSAKTFLHKKQTKKKKKLVLVTERI